MGITIGHDNFGLIGYLGIALILAGTALGRSIEQRDRVPPIVRADEFRKLLADIDEGVTCRAAATLAGRNCPYNPRVTDLV